MKQFAFLLLLLAGYVNHVQGQDQPSDYGQWLMYFGDNRVTDKWGIHSELQLRNYPLGNTVQQTLARTGINFYTGANAMATAGYAYVYTHPGGQLEGHNTVSENRIWQQLIFRQKSKIVFLEHRYRLEQRFMHNLTTDNAWYDNRMRYRLQALFPLYTISTKLRHYFINTYNEYFVNFGKRHPGTAFDRNRLYVAIGYQFNPKVNVQLGYLNQVINIPGAEQPEINHNLQVGVFYNLEIIRAGDN